MGFQREGERGELSGTTPDEAMSKQLVFKPERCVGCRTCELVCSYGHFEQFNPRMSAVSVVDYEVEAVSIPLMCMQCDDAACAAVCPVEALKIEADGFVSYDPDKCIKCKMCMNACPLGSIHYTPIGHRMIKCDLCGGGDPKCARYCHANAIEVVDNSDLPERRKDIAKQLMEVYRTDKTEEVAQ